MAEVMKIATRDSYGKALVALADAGHDEVVVFDADLSASTKTCLFQKAYPKRFFDCGIAESNMMGVAAGMSTFGYVPFVSSFAMFASGRAWEQVRNSIGYPHLNVKIAATHGGLSVGEDGASHQCCEDFALMRSIPGMVVMCPADDVEARACVRAAYEHEGPVYIRFSRLATPVFHDPEKYTLTIGKGETLAEGFDIAVISTGLMTSEALKAALQLKKQQGSLSVRVINMPCIKPLDEELVRARRQGVQEDHHGRGAQRHRRPGRRRVQRAGREVPGAGAPPRRAGQLRPFRHRARGPQGLWPDGGEHRQCDPGFHEG